MYLTKRFRIKPTDELIRLCHVSNDLYNQTLYHWKQRYEKDGVILRFFDLDPEMREVTNSEGEKNYRLMPARVSSCTVKMAWADISSFLSKMKSWKQSPKDRQKPEFPHYHKSGGMTAVHLDKLVFKIEDGRLIYNISKGCYVTIPNYEHWKDHFKKAKMVRVLPSRNDMAIDITYEADIVKADVSKDRMAAIDLGVDNLCTVVCQSGCTIYNGKPLKSYNQFFSKQLAKATSILYKQYPGEKPSSNRIRQMHYKRKRYIDTYMHTVSRKIVNHLIEEHVGLLIVGHNKGWKRGADLRKEQNQKFAQTPFLKIQKQLKYKCEMAGIEYVEQEESYTSKCDALAMERIAYHDKYAGWRKNRGLFKSSTGKAINADQNGALNILRKYTGDERYLEVTAGWHLAGAPKIVNVVCES